jgi:hypothetical protein
LVRGGGSLVGWAAAAAPLLDSLRIGVE